MFDIRVANGKPLKRKYLVFVGDVFLRETGFYIFSAGVPARKGREDGTRDSEPEIRTGKVRGGSR